MLAGVGGQGLVLTTRIIAEAAFKAGHDVKTNDVVGLSQRGGKIWGSVKYGDRVFSPDILPGRADFLVAIEPLEGLRHLHELKADGWILLNENPIPPTPVLMEKEPYPEIEFKAFDDFKVFSIDAAREAGKLGNPKIANTILIGALAGSLDIPKEIWISVIEELVPAKTIEKNLKAFDIGFKWKHSTEK
jgi:indolepyruvate ferredoxin oxidoreductase beta subunit